MANAVLWPTKRFSKHPELPFSIFILQGLTVWQHRTLWEHKLEHRCFSLEGHGRFQYGMWIQGAGGQMPGRNRPWHQSSDAAPNAEVRWSTAILQKSSKCFATVVLFDLGFFHVPAHGSIATAQREPKIHKSAADEVDMLLLTLEPSHLSHPTFFQAQLGYLAQALLHDLTLHKSAWSSKLPGQTQIMKGLSQVSQYQILSIDWISKMPQMPQMRSAYCHRVLTVPWATRYRGL